MVSGERNPHKLAAFGLCPGSPITGGKIKSPQTRKVINRALNFEFKKWSTLGFLAAYNNNSKF